MTRPVVFDFERLVVFDVALEAVVAVEVLVGQLPTGRAYMRDQLRRASNSIPLNIAEGSGEFLDSEKARFYRMAKRSATECAGQLMVARRLGVLPEHLVQVTLDLLRRVVSMLVKLVRTRSRTAASSGTGTGTGTGTGSR